MSHTSKSRLGNLGKLFSELRVRIYHHYFADADVTRIPYISVQHNLPVDTVIKWKKDYRRDLLLTSSTIYKEACWVERATNFCISMGVAPTRELAPFFLRKKTTEIDFAGESPGKIGKFPAHEYAILQKLSFSDVAFPSVSFVGHVDDLFKGRLDASILARIQTLTSLWGLPCVEKPELLPEDFIIAVKWHCFVGCSEVDDSQVQVDAPCSEGRKVVSLPLA